MHDLFPREQVHGALARRNPHRPSQVLVTKKAEDRVGQPLGISGLHQPARYAVLYDLRYAADACANSRHSGCHGFGNRHAEGLCK